MEQQRRSESGAPEAPRAPLFPVHAAPLFPGAAAAAPQLALGSGGDACAAQALSVPDWTRLSSFAAPAAPPAAFVPFEALQRRDAAHAHAAAAGDSSDSDSGGAADVARARERKRARKERKHEERRERKRARSDAEKIAAAEEALARAGGGGAPASARLLASAAARPSAATSAPPPHFFDTRPDWENVALGGAHRAAVPRFCRAGSYLATKGVQSGGENAPPHALVPFFGARRGYDGAGLDTAAAESGGGGAAGAAALDASHGRYFSRAAVAAARSRTRRRLRLARGGGGAADVAPPPPLPAFVPFAEGGAGEWASAEERYRCHVAALNAATRERPYELAPWLALAALQDGDDVAVAGGAASRRRRGGAAGAAASAQKKVAVLERALGHHPGSEALLVALLAAAAEAEAPPAVEARWAAALRAAPGAPRLWAARAAALAASGASPVERVRASLRACVALAAERGRRAAAGAPAAALAPLDAALCCHVIAATRTQLQAGCHEASLSRLQAALEYACFFPVQLAHDTSARRRAFERFWRSGAPRVGEPDADGWAAWWLQRQERHTRAVDDVATAPPPPPPPPPPTHTQPAADADAAMPPVADARRGASDAAPDDVDAAADVAEADVAAAEEDAAEPEEDEEDDEALLARLGVTLDPATLTSALSERTLRRWVDEERSRDAACWQPRADAAEPDAQGLPYDAVEDGLFELHDEAAQLALLTAAAALLGAPLPPCRASSDDASSAEASTLEAPPPSLAALLGPAATSLLAADARGGGEAAWLMGTSGRGAFCDALLAVAAQRFPRHVAFADALLARAAHGAAARAVAKPLLASARDAAALAAALAAREAALGRMPQARKLFAGALGAAAAACAAARVAPLAVLSSQQQHQGGTAHLAVCAPAADAVAVALRCAEAEAMRGDDVARARALAVLTSLGEGALAAPPETPATSATATSAPSPERAAAARRGFQAALCALAAAGALGAGSAVVTEVASDVVAAAALHARLDAGGGADVAGALIDAALAVVPTEARRRSAACEALSARRLRYLRADARARPAARADAAAAALAMHPSSPAVLAAVIGTPEGDGPATSPATSACAPMLPRARLRRCLDAAWAAAPCVAVLLASLGCERTAADVAGDVAWGYLRTARCRALLERAAAHPATAASPLTWRLVLLATSATSAASSSARRRAFFRAAAAAPGCKALWLAGLEGVAGGATSAAERATLLAAAAERGVRCRADVYEVALQEQAEALLADVADA